MTGKSPSNAFIRLVLRRDTIASELLDSFLSTV